MFKIFEQHPSAWIEIFPGNKREKHEQFLTCSARNWCLNWHFANFPFGRTALTGPQTFLMQPNPEQQKNFLINCCMIVACFANNIQSQHGAELVKCSNEMKRVWKMAMYKWIEAIIDHQSST
jgi:hypothetical protein